MSEQNTNKSQTFQRCPNVVVTPHVAFDSVEAVYRILKTTVDNINSFLEGNIINKVN